MYVNHLHLDDTIVSFIQTFEGYLKTQRSYKYFARFEINGVNIRDLLTCKIYL